MNRERNFVASSVSPRTVPAFTRLYAVSTSVAGEPVTDDHDDLFGAVVQLAARLCGAASPGDIAVSLGVRALCVGEAFHFDDLGNFNLKGLPEPTPAYGVCWREVAS
jgi:class 3 adenylate cyclase